MPDLGEAEWGSDERSSWRREGLVAVCLGAARALEAEQDRWFLWLPVLFAGGTLAYFALADEPGQRLAAALLLGAIGLCLAFRHARAGPRASLCHHGRLRRDS